ncbi:MAG: hypothetical protein EOP11_13770 [Proteobacteria bacterium]|nr:MAG: hypothetical protein EOP11_13770 [Pseudomonadota bacterium]
MKLIILFLGLSTWANFAQGEVICRNGPVNPDAKAVCADALAQYGKIRRIGEGYSAIRFNQFTRFCAAMDTGEICRCSYSWMGTPQLGPDVRCERPDAWTTYRSCVASIREECRE